MKIKNKTVSIILFIALVISQWTINAQRKEINTYKEYVEQIHDHWTSSNDSTGWHKEIFTIPEKDNK